MGRASREKRDRKVQAQIQAALAIHSANNSRQAWYESNLLWVPLSTSIAIVLTVMAAMIKDLRFLLWPAAALLIHPCWVISGNLGIKRGSVTRCVFALLLGVLVFGTYKGYVHLKEDPIAVSPSQISLAQLSFPGSNRHGHFDVTVYNRGDDPHYQIWVKVLLQSKTATAEMFDVDYLTIEELERAGRDVMELSSRTMCLPGRDDKGYSALLCNIDTLSPKETFKIRFTAKEAVPNDDLGKMETALISYEEMPSSHYETHDKNENTTGVRHELPRGFSSKAMIHYCFKGMKGMRSDMAVTCSKNSRSNIQQTK